MLRFVASFLASNTKPTDEVTNTKEEENSQVDIITTTTTTTTTTTETDEVDISPIETEEHSDDIDISNETISEELSDEDLTLLQSLRKQQQQEFVQKVLLRKISHQAVMNYYAQDYLPLSELQEKLEEDNIPLVLLQKKLKRRNGISTYTTTKENINFLLSSQSLPRSLLTKSKKFKQAPTTLITDDGDAPKDIRDYDVWDDAIIGHLMNLIDTIGMETIQEEASEEVTKEDVPKEEKESREVRKGVEEESREVGKESKEAAKEAKKESGEMGKEAEKESREIGKESEKGSREIGKEAEKESSEIVEEAEKESKEVVKESKKIMKILGESKEAVRESRESKESKKVKKAIKESKKVLRESNEVVKEAVQEEVKEKFINKSPSASIYNFSEGSEDEDQEITVVESSTIKNNTVRKKMNCESIAMAEEIINFGETINVAESLVISSNRSSIRNKRRSKIDSGYGENSISTENVKRESKPFRKPRSMFSLRQSSFSSTDNNNLNRKSSIHSRKSYENDISRCSSVSSKFSIGTTPDVIMEEPNEDGFENIKFRSKFFTDPKRSSFAQKSSNKSLHFLRNLWKSNQNLSSSADGGENLSNKEFMERYYYQQGDSANSDRELNYHANLQRSCTTTGVSSDTGYSNFYLAMPNGKWMVRTRTASRKITGTQYVDKEYI